MEDVDPPDGDGMTTTFTGEVRIPGSIENGLPSTITLDAQTLVLTAGGTELGRWNRSDLKLRREADGTFHLTLGREVVLFNPDSPSSSPFSPVCRAPAPRRPPLPINQWHRWRLRPPTHPRFRRSRNRQHPRPPHPLRPFRPYPLPQLQTRPRLRSPRLHQHLSLLPRRPHRQCRSPLQQRLPQRSQRRRSHSRQSHHRSRLPRPRRRRRRPLRPLAWHPQAYRRPHRRALRLL